MVVEVLEVQSSFAFEFFLGENFIKMDLEKSHDPTTVVPYNNRDSPLEGGHYTIIGGMRDLKHEIISSKFYEILTKTELKGEIALDLKNFYNHIKMYINEVKRLREDLITA